MNNKILQFIRNHGGYYIGHLPIIRQIIVKTEDWINKKGLPTSNFRRSLARAIHEATGNSIFYLDYVNGNDANDGSSWASAWKTITNGAIADRIAPGDIIRIAKSPAPTSIGNATWTNQSKTVTLATAQNQTIELCVSEDTLILTENGWKYVKDIKVGDFVYTHKGRLRKVTKTFIQKGKLYNVKVNRMDLLKATGTHPVLSCNFRRKNNTRDFSDWEWRKISDLKISERREGIGLATLTERESKIREIGTDVAWLYGFYTADGCATNAQVRFFLNSEKDIKISERLKEIIHGLGYHVSEWLSPVAKLKQIYFSDSNFAHYLNQECGHKREKQLPPDIFTATEEEKLAFLSGYFAGDGTVTSDGIRAATISKKIVFGVWQLLRDCGFVAAIGFSKRNGEMCKFIHPDGKIYEGQPQWTISLNSKEALKFYDKTDIKQFKEGKISEWESRNKSKNFTVGINGNYYVHPIRDIVKNEEEETVYNFEVEEDNSYIADGFVVHNCETVWTASTNVTATTSTTQKEGSYSASLAIAAAFTTGKVAYKSFTALDLSGYQKISFWIRNDATISANCLKVVLCSDTTGDTIVDTFYIPAIPSTGRWLPLTIARNGGGNLGSSIQSIAVYADTDPGTVTLLLDNFIACTTNGLNLQSLISKNSAEQGGTEGWYGIQSINGTTVLLDNETNTEAESGRGYSGTTETVTTYKRETIKTALAASSSTQVQAIQDSGTSGNNIQFQGGYNTSTSEQDGETFFDGLNGNGYGIYLNEKSYITLNYLNVCRYNFGIYYNSSNNNTITTLSNANNNYYGIYYASSNNNTITTLSNVNNNSQYGICYATSSNNTIATLSNANNNYYGIYYYSSSHNNTITTLSNANNNYNTGIYYNSSNNNTITTLSNVNNNGQYGVLYTNSNNNTIITLSNANNNYYSGIYYNNSSNNIIRSLSTTGNGTTGVFNNTGTNYLFNALIAEATEVWGYANSANSKIFSHKHDQTADNHVIFTDGGQIRSTTAVRHTDSGIAWRMDVTSTNRSSSYPLSLSIAKIAVAANATVTVKAWFRRNNTGITGRLVCKGKQIAGVDSDVVATTSAAADTWEELSIQFQPSENGVVEITAEAYGGNSYSVWIDDMTIQQS